MMRQAKKQHRLIAMHLSAGVLAALHKHITELETLITLIPFALPEQELKMGVELANLKDAQEFYLKCEAEHAEVC